ncbi:HNH endonuclease [Nitrobacter sp. TKz-YC02]|uniref:HNH endonuclease n=1 Tax=Nitrobacter sp. TKz-YC02 TaxID=3398704 RepID=UPI003CEC9F4E
MTWPAGLHAVQAFLLNVGTLPWKAWYKTARWRALRHAVFLRDLYTCRKCGKAEPNTSLLVCDHKSPHRGDKKLFWDERNLQTLCKACHDRFKQSEEQGSLHTRGVWY